MTRADIRTRVRDYIYEDVANIFSDVQLDRFFLEELRALPSNDIYKEEIWETNLVANQQSYALPTGVFKLERLERNDGTATTPLWTQLQGWDCYGDNLYLDFMPLSALPIRGYLRMFFTDVNDDSTTLEIPNDKSEALVWGIIVRCYKSLMGYKTNSKSWDSVTRPADVSMTSIQSWLRDAKKEYQSVVGQYKTVLRPRDIDLTS